MTRLVIAASPLLGRWSTTSATRRDRVTWPPSPDTVFSALVAAAASLGNARHPALYWLENQGNPAIEADPDPPVVQGVVHFCPVADRTPWEKGARQGRWQNSVGHPDPVSWSWPLETAEHVEDLGRIAQEVTYIGSSRAPVLATAHVATTDLPGHALVPHAAGPYRLRGIYPGRLGELEAAFQAGRRPGPTLAVGYARAADKPLRSIWGQMIPLRRIAGPRLHIEHSVPITEAVRLALTRHLPDGAPGLLTGHGPEGGVLAGEHLAIIPLARVDEHGSDRYADGDVLGVGLLLPAGCDDATYNLLITGLQGWLAAGGRVEIGGTHRWVMEVAHGDHRRALRPSRLLGHERTWSSATPVICDRHPRRDLGLREVVAAMCRDVGLPPPEHVVASPHGAIGGSTDSRRHSLGRRSYLARHYVTHLRVTWARPVPGPILLGRGRYFGLGAMLPVTAEAAA